LTEAIKLKDEPISTETLSQLIVESIQDTKGKKIVQLDLRDIPEAPTDFFIVCEGDSITQVRAISENIKKTLRDDYGIPPSRSEGIENSKWILVDYFDVVVHIFHPETRSYYELEELWSDAKVTSIAEA
jgi:ribosome-associated protein